MGSEMCIRDRLAGHDHVHVVPAAQAVVRDRQEGVRVGRQVHADDCLLYTSDAADERSSVDLGGRRIIKKKNSV